MNLEFRRLQENLVNQINAAQLPIEGKRLVVLEILHKIEMEAERIIIQEIEEQKQQENTRKE